MSKFGPKPMSSGAVLQAGIPFGPPQGMGGNGMLVRGVVMATYVYDDPNHPFANAQPAAIYCDVLVYTQLTGGRTYLLKNALVTTGFAGLQSGVITKPKASTQTISGAPLDPTQPIDPSQLDGDHVLVGFMDDRRFQPVILTGIPPPNQGIGHDGDTVGQRMRLVQIDGMVKLEKYMGVISGVTADGFLIDASQSSDGSLDANGREIPSALGGKVVMRAKLAGGVSTELMSPSTSVPAVSQTLGTQGLKIDFGALPGAVSILGAQGPVLAIPAVPSPTAAVQIGAGTATVVSSSLLTTYLASLVNWLKTHTHTSAAPGSPTSPPVIPPPVVPSVSNNSLKVPE